MACLQGVAHALCNRLDGCFQAIYREALSSGGQLSHGQPEGGALADGIHSTSCSSFSAEPELEENA